MRDDQERLLHTVSKVVNVLQHSGIRFAVAGGCAVYAHGGPMPDHDVDVFVKRSDAMPARRALVAEGMRAVDPPETWLTKVYDGDRLVDLIFEPNHRPVTDTMLDRAQTMRIGPTRAPVIPATELVIDKLLVLEPHRCDFTPLLQIVRSLREQLDWPHIAAETSGSPYARAFLYLIEALGVTDTAGPMPHPEVVPQARAMTGPGYANAPEYQAARLRRAVAEDPRTAELGVSLTVHGGQVQLSGSVASERRKDELTQVLSEAAPDLEVRNDVVITGVGQPGGPEDMS